MDRYIAVVNGLLRPVEWRGRRSLPAAGYIKFCLDVLLLAKTVPQWSCSGARGSSHFQLRGDRARSVSAWKLFERTEGGWYRKVPTDTATTMMVVVSRAPVPVQLSNMTPWIKVPSSSRRVAT